MTNTNKKWRKEKWQNRVLTSDNIDDYMQDLYDDTKGQYITQGVSFNKDDVFQMNLLKQALLSHGSFSGFIKHLMHSYFINQQNAVNNTYQTNTFIPNRPEEKTSPVQVVQAISAVEENAPVTNLRENGLIKRPRRS